MRSTCLQSLYGLGARRIGVTSLPPMGCLPAAITLFGGGCNECVVRLNNDAILFNKKMNAAAQALQKEFPDLKLVVFDIYNPLLDLINNPSDNGFFSCSLSLSPTHIIILISFRHWSGGAQPSRMWGPSLIIKPTCVYLEWNIFLLLLQCMSNPLW